MDQAALLRELAALGLHPSPEDVALALPALLQVETMTREMRERLAYYEQIENVRVDSAH